MTAEETLEFLKEASLDQCRLYVWSKQRHREYEDLKQIKMDQAMNQRQDNLRIALDELHIEEMPKHHNRIPFIEKKIGQLERRGVKLPDYINFDVWIDV